MPTLASELRNKLERVVIDARDAAEIGARAALEALAVHHHAAYPHMKTAQIDLRKHLRAHAQQLGDRRLPKPDSKGKDLEIDHLAGECAYEHWHRMLFARFLAENNLLIEPEEKMAISLAEAEELAKEDGVNVWVFASRCAQGMLPQIFRPDDPLLQVSFATEHMLKLEKLLASLPQAVFTASDALGWVYQFWQSKKKDEVNRSEVKIGADEIGAVTQLFTEPYMVEFLLQNTLGAWWAGKQLLTGDIASAETEEELRYKVALPGVKWEYLRFVRGAHETGGVWRPAAGTFDGWPKKAAELKILDPCCGSGHFLVAALSHLTTIRMKEEGLSAREAVDAVLRNNLYGLEIDERCCQIAAFALALAAWTYPGAGGYRLLPNLNIAHTGISIGSTRDQWLRILEGPGTLGLRFFFNELYEIFRKASTLGSLINPHRFLGSGMLDNKGMETLQRHLQTAIADDPNAPPEKHELGIAAQGLARAVKLLADRYSLVITNVPYLGRGKQDDLLKNHLETQYPLGKADLATAFVLRCMEFCAKDGATALVTPQNWLFLTTYTRLRIALLDSREWCLVARLGPGAFEGISGQVVNAALSIITARKPSDVHVMAGLDATEAKLPQEKASLLGGYRPGLVSFIPQSEQLEHPDSVILLAPSTVKTVLGEYADCYQGVKTGDNDRLCIRSWELPRVTEPWRLMQSSPSSPMAFEGCTDLINWYNDGALMARLQGLEGIGAYGIGVGSVSSLQACFFLGQHYDSAIIPIIPKNPSDLAAISAFCFDPSYREAVRQIDQKVAVTTATVLKVPFDREHWQAVSAKEFPNGLPDPESDDPTQWLFHGWPDESTAPLQVAVARLLGYRWPAEFDEKMKLSKRARTLVKCCNELTGFVADSGIICIPSVRGEEPATERLEALLTAAGIKPKRTRDLTGGSDLDEWLHNRFFEEHCKLFHNRPFIWQIWDGRARDGFHALVNYHKLCEGNGKGRRLLESLTYAYLGEWISRQKDGVKRGEGGAEDRMAAAVELQNKLKLILEGESPFDLFVRWKPLAEQPIGWEPDINDGVRMNIRPFLASDLPAGRAGAGVLRWKPNVKWEKDRGKEPKRPIREFPWFWDWNGSIDYAGHPLAEFTGERFNDCHYSGDFKRQSRLQAGNTR